MGKRKNFESPWGIEPQNSDTLPLSHRDSTVSEVYYEVHMTRVLHAARIINKHKHLESWLILLICYLWGKKNQYDESYLEGHLNGLLLKCVCWRFNESFENEPIVTTYTLSRRLGSGASLSGQVLAHCETPIAPKMVSMWWLQHVITSRRSTSFVSLLRNHYNILR